MIPRETVFTIGGGNSRYSFLVNGAIEKMILGGDFNNTGVKGAPFFPVVLWN